MLADIVWSGAALIVGLLSFWTILLGLLVEWPFVKWILKIDWLKSLLVTVLINLASLVIGTLLIGLMTILMGVGLTVLLEKGMLNINGDVLFWILAFFVTLLITIGIEGLALILSFKTKLFKKIALSKPPLSRMWIGLTLANLLSVSITYLFIFFTMIHPTG